VRLALQRCIRTVISSFDSGSVALCHSEAIRSVTHLVLALDQEVFLSFSFTKSFPVFAFFFFLSIT